MSETTALRTARYDRTIPPAPQYLRSILRAAGTLTTRTADGSLRCMQCSGTVEAPVQCTQTRAPHRHSY